MGVSSVTEGMMAEILELRSLNDPMATHAVEVMERGGVVLLAAPLFEVRDEDAMFLDPAILSGRAKNISFDPRTGELGGTALQGLERAGMTGLIERYAQKADDILAALTPAYLADLQKRRTSFRPAAIETRALSPRKDDKRLHVDAFPANPVQGRRILRVFSNVHPCGEHRRWNIGDHTFSAFAEEFKTRINPRPSGLWRERLGLTKGPRTAYDTAMLQLHDGAKFDDAWQAQTPRTQIDFPPGATWTVFTDAVLHAALSGQHAFEQTYLLPVAAMNQERRSPLRILERQTERPLV